MWPKDKPKQDSLNLFKKKIIGSIGSKRHLFCYDNVIGAKLKDIIDGRSAEHVLLQLYVSDLITIIILRWYAS